MSQAAGKRDVNIKITEQLSLVSSQHLIGSFDFQSGCSGLDDHIWRNNDVEVKGLAENHLYFTFSVSGYIADPYKPKLIQYFLDELRSFYGACLAHGLLVPYVHNGGVSPIVMGVDKSEHKISHVSRLDSDLVEATYFAADSLKTRSNKIESFKSAIAPVIKLFTCDSTKLKTASIWLLRAKSSYRPIDTILESAITLEVLLGDQKMADRIGLTKLMANRCGYALGCTVKERESLIDFFTKFYKLRSDVVHAGTFSHSDADLDVVERGLDLAARMLVFEQSLSDGCL
jgi:hypothetical protein